MTVPLALLAVLTPASVTLIGYWFKRRGGGNGCDLAAEKDAETTVRTLATVSS
jgi:hypothetical protein